MGWLIWVSRILKKENRRPTLQSQVLEEAIHCQPLEKSIWSVVGQVQLVVAGGSSPTIDWTALATTLWSVNKQKIKHMMSKSPFDVNIQTKKIDNPNNKLKKFIANKNETTLTFCICLYIHWTYAYFLL